MKDNNKFKVETRFIILVMMLGPMTIFYMNYMQQSEMRDNVLQLLDKITGNTKKQDTDVKMLLDLVRLDPDLAMVLETGRDWFGET